MSKLLKLIVNLFLVCAILIGVAILVPPLIGVSTTVIDTPSLKTNLPLGSITYSRDIAANQIAPGDVVLKEQNDATYKYVIKEKVDAETFRVQDATNAAAETEEITLRNLVARVVLTVPLIGYFVIAMQSLEGIIIVGLVVLSMIILFILSELWKRNDDDEDEEDADDDEEDIDDAVETVREAVAVERAAPLVEVAAPAADGQPETVEIAEAEETVEPAAVAEEMVEPAAVAEDAVETVAEVEETTEAAAVAEETVETAAEVEETTEAAAVAKETVKAATKVEETTKAAVETEAVKPVREVVFEEKTEPVEEVASVSEVLEVVPEEEERTSGDVFIPIERATLEEIMEQAKKDGDSVEVRKDEVTGITIVDYSDVI